MLTSHGRVRGMASHHRRACRLSPWKVRVRRDLEEGFPDVGETGTPSGKVAYLFSLSPVFPTTRLVGNSRWNVSRQRSCRMVHELPGNVEEEAVGGRLAVCHVFHVLSTLYCSAACPYQGPFELNLINEASSARHTRNPTNIG